MATFGAITFNVGVQGVIRPRTAPAVDLIPLVDQTLSTRSVPGQPGPSQVTYRGWFSSSQKTALYATIDTTITAHDETGASHTVRVLDVQVAEVAALDGSTVGVLCACLATLQDWPA